MKRSEIKRKTPLVSRAPLKRTAFKRKAPKSDIPSRVRKEIAERSEGLCEIRREGICTYYAQDIDHIKNRPHCSKEEKHSLDNLQHACRPCHRWKTENPDEAEAEGFYKRNEG